MARHVKYLWLIVLVCAGGCHDPLGGLSLRQIGDVNQGWTATDEIDQSSTTSAGQNSLATPKRTEQTQTSTSLHLVSHNQVEELGTPKQVPKINLSVPPDIPGAQLGPIKLPSDPKELETYLKKLYQDLPPLEAAPVLAAGPEGRPLTLGDLQRLASLYSPTIRAAEGAVVAAQGALRQSLAYPNPNFFYEHDTAGTGTAGYPGFGVDQLIKTSNKLELAGASAKMDLLNAQLALRKARFDVAYQVRLNYFALLVAQENIKVSRAFAEMTDQIYGAQVKLLLKNVAAAYEPLQLRALALGARLSLVTATNQYQASWRLLVTNVGLPDMPLSEVAGRVDTPVPVFDYEQVRARVLNQHTDVLTAKNNIYKAEFNLQLAKVQPIPDVDINLVVQKDYTSAPNFTVASCRASVALPVWDLNRGNILQAQGNLNQALHNLPTAQNTLLNSLADAFNRYSTSKRQVEITLQQVIDQVRAYQAIYNSMRGGGGRTFTDVVTAQQSLAGYITAYVAALGLQWTAVADMANLMQTEDLFKGTHGPDCPDVPPLEQLESWLRCLPTALGQEKIGEAPAVAANNEARAIMKTPVAAPAVPALPPATQMLPATPASLGDPRQLSPAEAQNGAKLLAPGVN